MINCFLAYLLPIVLFEAEFFKSIKQWYFLLSAMILSMICYRISPLLTSYHCLSTPSFLIFLTLITSHSRREQALCVSNHWKLPSYYLCQLVRLCVLLTWVNVSIDGVFQKRIKMHASLCQYSFSILFS
jgi:hypothetical protein